MLIGIEGLVSQVEGVLHVCAGNLDVCGDGNECYVAGDDGLSGVLRPALCVEEIPAAHLLAFRSRSCGVVDIECADGLVLLAGELTEDGRLVGVDVCQFEVGLLYDVQHVSH